GRNQSCYLSPDSSNKFPLNSKYHRYQIWVLRLFLRGAFTIDKQVNQNRNPSGSRKLKV
ncbi:hypothetical protein MKX01_020639, partial [Papaver californicum]